jgi:bifunctional DNA-binding transcriptional regulator/antitoxin component of YhaV-PrlF toxin-antitoxin module
MLETIVTVTKKGQATIPKALRKKHKIGKKVLAIDTAEGVLFKPVQDPVMEKGSLKELFGPTTSRQLIDNARAVEIKREKKLLEKAARQ